MSYTTVQMEDMTISATEGRFHHGVCRTLSVPVVDMYRATSIHLATVWMKGNIEDVKVELMSGSETGSPWLELWATLPDGTRIKEGINVVDLVQAWIDAIVRGETKKGNEQ